MVPREEDEPTKDERLKEIAKSVEHQLTHTPKKKSCKTCMRSKQDALPARSLRVERSLTDGAARKAFGDRVHVDHVIVAKVFELEPSLALLPHTELSGLFSTFFLGLLKPQCCSHDMIQSCSLALHFYFLYNTSDTFMHYVTIEHPA